MSPKSKKSSKKEVNKPQLRAKKKKNYKEVNEVDSFNEIDRSIATLGLIIKDVEGDGNCLFRALSDQMFGDEDHHEELREKVCNYIEENSEHFQNFFDSDDETLEKHLSRMRNIGTFGDNFELVAFANMHSLDIHLYQDGSANIMVIKGASLENDQPKEQEKSSLALHLAYHSWEHYSSIRNLAGPFDGLPNIDLDEIKQRLKEDVSRTNEGSESETSESSVPTLNPIELKNLERIQKVMERTKCQDEELIRNVLLSNQNNLAKTTKIIGKHQRDVNRVLKEETKKTKRKSKKTLQKEAALTETNSLESPPVVSDPNQDINSVPPMEDLKRDTLLEPNCNDQAQIDIVKHENPTSLDDTGKADALDGNDQGLGATSILPESCQTKTQEDLHNVNKDSASSGSFSHIDPKVSDDSQKSSLVKPNLMDSLMSTCLTDGEPCSQVETVSNTTSYPLNPPANTEVLPSEQNQDHNEIPKFSAPSSGTELVTSHDTTGFDDSSLKESVSDDKASNAFNTDVNKSKELADIDVKSTPDVPPESDLPSSGSTSPLKQKASELDSASPSKKKTKSQSKRKPKTTKESSINNDKPKSPNRLGYILI